MHPARSVYGTVGRQEGSRVRCVYGFICNGVSLVRPHPNPGSRAVFWFLKCTQHVLPWHCDYGPCLSEITRAFELSLVP